MYADQANTLCYVNMVISFASSVFLLLREAMGLTRVNSQPVDEYYDVIWTFVSYRCGVTVAYELVRESWLRNNSCPLRSCVQCLFVWTLADLCFGNLQMDSFVFKARNVGKVEAITIGHDGMGDSPAWFCEQVCAHAGAETCVDFQ